MKLLVLGGTKFLGRAIVDAARERGHTITLFNRGQQDPGAYPELEQVHGDRTKDLSPLAGRRFDAVIDTACYLPRDATSAATFFTGEARADRWVFVSSISALATFDTPGYDESTPVARLTPEQEKEVDALSAEGPIPAAKLGPYYGPLKALCEEAAIAAFGAERTFVVRPGLIVGPYDNTDRFTYWPARFLRGGIVLAPGTPERVVQFIDVRDLGDWIVRALERGMAGTFHATGPEAPLPFGDVLEACARVAARRGAPPSTLTWVDDAFLLAHEVGPWMELPLWIPMDADGMHGFLHADCAKAIAAGLTFRPLADTIEATLDWLSRTGAEPRAAGLSAGKEAELLAAARA